MRLHLKEDPKEWRKSALLSLIGPTVLCGLLRWRGVISTRRLSAVLVVLALVALCACARPGWFRGYYRCLTRLGFYTIQALGRVVLVVFFFAVLTPFGWIMRLAGKDVLQLKPPPTQPTYWRKARSDGSLDRMF